jgi:hypothetical protein
MQARERRRGPEGQEDHQRQEEDHPDQPPQQPVRPLPEEDEFELVQRHAGVDLGVLRNLPVFAERLHPVRLVQRRDRAHDRLPFRDRQARTRQARDPAHHHHQEDQRRRGEQPDGHGAITIWIPEPAHSTLDADTDMLPFRR